MLVIYLTIASLLCWIHATQPHSVEDATHPISRIKKWIMVSKFTNETIEVLLSKGHKDRYDVTIDMHRSQCNTEVLTRISPSNYTDQFAKMFMGPDEFVLNVEGKEILAHVPKYIDCGVYHASFHLLLTGFYHIKVSRLRSNFTAINEYIMAFPAIQLEYVVTDWVELIGSKSKSESCNHMHYGAWIEKTSSSGKSIYDTLATAQGITPILYHGGEDRSLPIKSYVPLGSEHAAKGCVNNVDLYNYLPVTGCHWNVMTPDEASQLLSQKILSIHGDSHMREFGNVLLKWACNLNNAFKKGSRTQIKVNNETDTRCQGLTITYLPNYFCYTLPFDGNEDLQVLNCGHHPASNEHQPVDVYKEELFNFWKYSNTSESKVKHDKFVWLETNPQPFRNDRFVFDYQDWRTLHRISAFNQIANNFWSHHNVSVIYSFQQLLPFADSGCDIAHYLAEGALYPIIVQFLETLKNKLT